ncbi:two component, sigma54 specific, transcriptional regulator, Fis family, partial [Aduncisulcus paluster]
EHRDILEMILKSNEFQTDTAVSGQEALKKLGKSNYHLVLSDLKMPEMSGLELLDEIKKAYPEQDVIIVTGYGTVKNAVDAMKRGAFSYFIKGHDPDELLMDIEKIMRLSDLKFKSDALLDSNASEFMMESKNPKFQESLRIIKSAANSNANILLL